jgi:hypothetical protein
MFNRLLGRERPVPHLRRSAEPLPNSIVSGLGDAINRSEGQSFSAAVNARVGDASGVFGSISVALPV